MKTVFTLMLLLSMNANASMYLYCQKQSDPAACALQAEAALEKLGCALDKEQTVCKFTLVEDPKKPDATIPSTTPYCVVISNNCSQPRVGNFGGETCDQGQKTQLAKADQVNNGYWFGLFGSYSRTICIVR